METAVRWSPTSNLSEQRFLLVDVKERSFKRCKVKRYDGTSLEHQPISTYSKVPGFRAFDWAPNDENLVAVGSWSGEVTLLHLDDSLPNVSFPAKRQRLCNAVAFSKTGILAAGLEGVRNDFCLNLWDVNQRLPAIRSPGVGTSKPFVEPYRRFASSEAISSIKFFSGQPEAFVSGIKGKGIRLYDLRDNSGNPALLFRTECVFNIAIDPLDENYFACAGPPDDRTIQIWDLRLGTSFSDAVSGPNPDLGEQAEKPVLEYKDVFKPQKASPKRFDGSGVMISNIWSLRYCKGKNGCLGALSGTGDFKVFETKQGFAPAQDNRKVQGSHDASLQTSSHHSMLTKHIHQVERANDDVKSPSANKERIVAFDFTNLASTKGTPTAIILRSDHTVDIVSLHGDPDAVSISSLGSVVVSRPYESLFRVPLQNVDDRAMPTAVRQVALDEGGKIADLILQLRGRQKGALSSGAEAQGKELEVRNSSRELHEALLQTQKSQPKLSLKDALGLLTITRRRCNEGYLFDVSKNIQILRDEPIIQDLWKWLDRAATIAKAEGMSTDLDLSYFGIASIWKNDLDSQRASSRSNQPTYSREVAIAVGTICEKLHLPKFHAVETNAPNHRRLCLFTCGLGLPFDSLENEVRDLVRQKLNIQAAALAVIHGEAKLAFLALRDDKTSSAHRELLVALAGYKKGLTDETWEETIDDLMKSFDDPYARAILAYVRNGNWHDVLTETSLSLQYRLGIALFYLDDDDLNEYINNILATSIDKGDIEGILLTGLTERAVPLFENYIRKTSDLQTAVLVMSFASPRYFTDPRVDLWRETYRSYLNTWKFFPERARFDVGSTKLSTPPKESPTLRLPNRQFALRCNNCDHGASRTSIETPKDTNTYKYGSHSERIFGKQGTLCPRCGRHLQRCALCGEWMGMSDVYPLPTLAKDKAEKDILKNLVAKCMACCHMMHHYHATEWFASHIVCPQEGCDCRCKDRREGRGTILIP